MKQILYRCLLTGILLVCALFVAQAQYQNRIIQGQGGIADTASHIIHAGIQPQISLFNTTQVEEDIKEGNYIPIRTVDDLQNINSLPNPNGWPYLLMNDIDFTGADWKKVEIRYLKRIYGQGYALKNYTGNWAPFSFRQAHLEDVIIDNFNISADYVNGLLSDECGAILKNVRVRNCKLQARVGQASILARTNEYFVRYQVQQVQIENCIFSMSGSPGVVAFVNAYGSGIVEDVIVKNCIGVQGTDCGAIGFNSAASINRVIVTDCDFTAQKGAGVAVQHQLPVSNCIVKTTTLNFRNPSASRRIVTIPYTIDAFNNYSTPIAGYPDGTATDLNGQSITVNEAKTQSFYESLGYDFNAGWRIGPDGYPEIAVPFKKFVEPEKVLDFSNENYIVSYSPYQAINKLDTSKMLTNIVYYDGLGRPMQEIAVNGTTLGHHLVRPIVYDALGREATTYLPYVQQSIPGAYIPTETAMQNQHAFYHQQHENPVPFTEIEYETSPLSRVIRQKSPDDNTINSEATTFAYRSNSGDEVKLWTLDAGGNLTGNGYYEANQLYITKTQLPENLDAIEYKDKSGRVIETRSQNRNDTSQLLCTSYVYDDLSRLRYVIPPKANEVGQSSAEFEALIYRYQYDGQGRMIAKKLPDSDEQHIVYDSRDRLVMSQDGDQREKSQWNIYLYDELNRPVADGIVTTALTRAQLTELYKNTSFNQLFIPFESSSAVFNTPAGLILTNNDIQNYTYYDNYEFAESYFGSFMDYTYKSTPFGEPNYHVTGMETAKISRITDEGNDNEAWRHTIIYYDRKYRPIQLRKYYDPQKGDMWTRLSIIDNLYTFDGLVEKVNEYQGGITISPQKDLANIQLRYRYDHLRRPVAIYHKNGDQAETLLSYTEYDELGRAQTKHMGDNAQVTDYAYNIRNWLTGINRGKNDPQHNAFSMELYYGIVPDSISHLAGPLRRDGNITTVAYRHNHSGGATNVTAYTYDVFGRLASGINNQMQTRPGELTHLYEEKNITYDRNGNILTLNRDNYTSGQSDRFDYRYHGNCLMKLGNKEYQYDRNGNMTRDGRLDLDITYNNLNLPRKVAYRSKTQNDSVEYLYSAAGEKLAKKYNGKFIEYYEGSVVYGEDKKPKYILHPEGMVRQDSTGNWLYQFNITDHLGNVRVVVDENRNVLQHTDYFPFGLAVNTNNLNINKYLYNGKELQDDILGGSPLGWLDYGARNYDPTLGRWGSIDPLAEKYYSYSPYNYALNNPINFFDPDGKRVSGVKYNEETNEFTYSKRALKDGTDKIINAALSTEGGKADLMEIVNTKESYNLILVEGPMYLDVGEGKAGQLEGYVDEAGKTMYISSELDKNTAAEGTVTLIKERKGEFQSVSEMKKTDVGKLNVSKGISEPEYNKALKDSGISEYNKNNPYRSAQEAIHGRFSHEKVHLINKAGTSTYEIEMPAMQNEYNRRREYNKKHSK